MVPGWALTSVERIARSVSAGFPSGEHNQRGEGIPHLRPMNIDQAGRLDRKVLRFVAGDIPRELRKGDVLFNNTNSPKLIGKTTSVSIDGRLAYSNHMTRISLESGFAPSFIARQLHFLWLSGYFLHRCANHVNQASLAAEPLSSTVPIVVAPFSEQCRIAETLDELFSDLDAGVAALERARERLKLYRASVLKAAVEGSLTADWRRRNPEAEPGAQLLKRILVERRRRWEKDQIGKFRERGKTPPKNWKAKYKEPVAPDTASRLPEGWCWTNIDILSVYGPQNGLYLPSEKYGEGIEILRIEDYQNNWVRHRNELKQVAAEQGDVGTFALQVGDLVINRVNSLNLSQNHKI